MGKKCRAWGVSMIEVMLALGFLAILSLTVIGVFTKLLGAQSKTAHGTVARLVAEQVAERAALTGPPNWGFPDGSMSEVFQLQVQDLDSPVAFTASIENPPTILKPAPPSNPMGALYLLKIEVNWWGDHDRVGMGLTKLNTSRAVYLEQ